MWSAEIPSSDKGASPPSVLISSVFFDEEAAWADAS